MCLLQDKNTEEINSRRAIMADKMTGKDKPYRTGSMITIKLKKTMAGTG
jgi:hypothetical protein